MIGSTFDDEPGKKPRRGAALFVLVACAYLGAWTVRHYFNGRHTSTMPIEEAIAELRSGKLNEDEARLATTVLRERVIEALHVLLSEDSTDAQAAMRAILEEVNR